MWMKLYGVRIRFGRCFPQILELEMDGRITRLAGNKIALIK